MKYVLAILCGAVVLFMGGCAVLTVQAMPLPLIPAGIAVLNVLILGALFGWKTKWRPAFYILGVIDLLIAVPSVVLSLGAGADAVVFAFAAALIGLKGILSIHYGYQLGKDAA
ncbi:MAG: hypothetical protein JNM45_00790 [Rhizobiales bacterium]|nr:hypothetical protein [Hyphomicrobiales bacterium]